MEAHNTSQPSKSKQAANAQMTSGMPHAGLMVRSSAFDVPSIKVHAQESAAEQEEAVDGAVDFLT